MSKSVKITLIAVVAILIILAVVFGCVFGIKCTVTLNYLMPNDYLIGLIRGKDKIESLKVTRFSQYAPPVANRDKYVFGGWFKDYSCTVPWLSTDKVSGNITLYAKWTKI